MCSLKKILSLWILKTSNSGTQHCLILSRSRCCHLGKIFLRHDLTDLLLFLTRIRLSYLLRILRVCRFSGLSLVCSTSLSQTTTILRPGFSFFSTSTLSCSLTSVSLPITLPNSTQGKKAPKRKYFALGRFPHH